MASNEQDYHPQDIDFNRLIEIEAEKAASATNASLLRSPLVINPRLYAFLEETSEFFHQGEWTTLNRSNKRFLASVGVLTCVTVFVWAKRPTAPVGVGPLPVSDEVVTFAAHIDAECYLGSQRFNNGDGHAFLLKMVASAFRGIDPSEVHCHVVGDHSAGCPAASTLQMGPELVSAMHRAGYQVHNHLFQVFPGLSLKKWQQDAFSANFSLYSGNQCFFFIALDCHTNKIVAQTRFVDPQNPCPMWPQRQCDLVKNGTGTRMFQQHALLNRSSGSFR